MSRAARNSITPGKKFTVDTPAAHHGMLGAMLGNPLESGSVTEAQPGDPQNRRQYRTAPAILPDPAGSSVASFNQ
jgi:hypothetical protein